MYSPTWVKIPAGTFLMGSDPASDAVPDANESPRHRVYLDLFQISRTPITNAQYEKFVRATNYSAPGHWLNGAVPPELRDHPVTYVDWRDAKAFCEWAGVRLPTEAEWEKAARGPSTAAQDDARLWPWGNEPPNASRANYARDVKTDGTTSVDQFPRGTSPYGVLDLAGNVWEWVSSLYREYPYDANDGRENLDSHAQRVLRGGSFYSPNENFIRCAARSLSYPQRRRDHIGFRVARK